VYYYHRKYSERENRSMDKQLMAMKKTEVITIESKPKHYDHEYLRVTHPKPENALATFEDLHGYTPKKMYHYFPPSGKFQSWIIVENGE
jgi:hypothetical protein